MKVSEAKTKICPFMSGADTSYPYVLCLCDRCMAWVYTKVREADIINGKVKMSKIEEDEKHGYCKRIGK